MFSHGLSCTHDFATRTTTAFMAGEYIASDDYCEEEPTLRLGIIKDVVKFLEDAQDHWSHPLLLPTIFGTLHIGRLATYAGQTLTDKVMDLEDELKATRVGRRDSTANVLNRRTSHRHLKEDDPELPKGLLTKEEAMKLTIRINTHATRLLVSKASQGWTRATSQTLLDCIDEYTLAPPASANSDAIRDQLKANMSKALYLENYLNSVQARLSLQLEVLYSFIAQTDSQYSAKLAALAGRDSTSMKILAFITTIYLPPTFVATMFSMDMFDWRRDQAAGTGSVSSQFWIYWW